MYLWHWPLIVFLNIYLLSLNALESSADCIEYRADGLCGSYRWIRCLVAVLVGHRVQKSSLIGFLIPALTITRKCSFG